MSSRRATARDAGIYSAVAIYPWGYQCDRPREDRERSEVLGGKTSTSALGTQRSLEARASSPESAAGGTRCTDVLPSTGQLPQVRKVPGFRTLGLLSAVVAWPKCVLDAGALAIEEGARGIPV